MCLARKIGHFSATHLPHAVMSRSSLKARETQTLREIYIGFASGM
jgi:hypothetical protein